MPPRTPDLPDGRELIEAVKQAMNAAGAAGAGKAAKKVLDQYKPGIDQYTDLEGAAAFLGLKGPASLHRNKFRTRSDGTPAWPDPDDHFGRSDVWMYRTIVMHYAESPGIGHPGMPRGPRKPKAAAGSDG